MDIINEMSVNVKVLYEKLLELSEAKNIREAVDEWRADYMFEKSNTNCICGNKISRVFKAENMVNGNVLSPIGSVCILRFIEEYEFKDSILYKTYMDCQRVYCEDCDVSLTNQTAYNIHLNTRKHIKNIGSRPCQGYCGVRIPASSPRWMTRCLKCYKNSK